MTAETRVAANLVEPGWQLRVLSDDGTRADWLEIHLALHTVRGEGQSMRVWIYPSDRAKPLIFEWDEEVSVRRV